MTKLTKPCREPDCGKQRFANQIHCFSHYRQIAKAKKVERAARKLERKVKSKGYIEKQRKGLKKKLDVVFSKLVRSHGKCERCGKGPDQVQLQCSHIYSRANLAIRWDLDNATCLCAYDHLRWWHQQPAEAVDWLKTVRSPEHLAALKQKANAARKWQVPELIDLLASLRSQLAEKERGFNP